MKFIVFSLFPKIFDGFINSSIIAKAIKDKKIDIEIVNFRDFSNDKNKSVDDYQYGGGTGMVLKLQPIVDAIKKYKDKNTKVVLLSPQGKTWKQSLATNFSKYKKVILICGRYEGFDERIENYVNEIISIGDYVLFGGEIPAMVIMESTIRLIKGIIQEQSHLEDSFTNNLLDYPVYTKPQKFDQYEVPSILLSGNEKEIIKWRKEQQIIKTKKKRPDLINK